VGVLRKFNLLRCYSADDGGKPSPLVHGLAQRNLRLPTHKLPEVLEAEEGTVQPRRGELQRIGTANHILHIEYTVQLAAHSFAVLKANTVRAVDIHAQGAPALTALDHLDPHQLVSKSSDDPRDNLLKPLSQHGLQRFSCPSKRKSPLIRGLSVRHKITATSHIVDDLLTAIRPRSN
jgi:hypothetical protein